MTVIEVI